MTVCKYEPCDYDDRDHRPYARLRDGIPSVSTIAGSIDDGKSRSFAWSASLIAATVAIHQPERWGHLDTGGCTHDIHQEPGLCDACKFVRSEFDRKWSAKATLGTHVHHLALSWACGQSVTADPRTGPYLDALEKFYADTDPEFLHLESTVAHDDPGVEYRGQFDFIARLDRPDGRRTGLWDIKTGHYYPVEQTLQLAGYRFANWLTRWDGRDQVRVGPMPVVEEAGVLLLGDDGEYRLVGLPADGLAFERFLGLRRAWGFAQEVLAWEKARKAAEAAA